MGRDALLHFCNCKNLIAHQKCLLTWIQKMSCWNIKRRSSNQKQKSNHCSSWSMPRLSSDSDKVTFGLDWVPKKLDVSIEMLEELDISILWGTGLRPEEEEMPDTAPLLMTPDEPKAPMLDKSVIGDHPCLCYQGLNSRDVGRADMILHIIWNSPTCKIPPTSAQLSMPDCPTTSAVQNLQVWISEAGGDQT
uniref:Uncharacterized protein n=1 Tax=Sphaerodactylus townsendi TaxID=933632 RepID=A0ACB8F326_9SAUR